MTKKQIKFNVHCDVRLGKAEIRARIRMIKEDLRYYEPEVKWRKSYLALLQKELRKVKNNK